MFAAGNTRRNTSFMAPSACYTPSQMAPLAQSSRRSGLLMDATAAWRHNRCVRGTFSPLPPASHLEADNCADVGSYARVVLPYRPIRTPPSLATCC
jgi:hypothetical protein